MSVWVPWDADEDEVVQLHVVREPIPDSMRPALREWLYLRLMDSSGISRESTVTTLQSALRINLEFERGNALTEELVNALEARGDKILLRTVDFLLALYEFHSYQAEPSEVEALRWHLDTSLAAIDIVLQDRVYRLGRRLPEGVEAAAQLAVDSTPKVAGRHLAKALREMQTLEPDTSAVMTEGIRAVEAAAGAVVTPKDIAPRLSKIVAALKDKSAWTVSLQRRDDGHPDHRAVLIGMLETLAFAQRDRHAGKAPAVVQAQGHVLLAANLVGWFSTGVIQMND